MPHLSELHGASTHLAVVAIPLYALLLVLRRVGWGGDRSRALEPWALAAAGPGIATSGITGLLVLGQSQTELRGGDLAIGTVHFWLGIALAVVVLALVAMRYRRVAAAAATALAVLALLGVVAQGYFGGRMTYQHGAGVEALGEARQTAIGASRLHVALAQGASPVAAGQAAFADRGLGCAGCHGDLAQGARGPRLAGGRGLGDFRRVHKGGLFPPEVVTDRDFATIDAYLKTLRSGRAPGASRSLRSSSSWR
ncbi:MAG TPA: hypothetical protein VF533_25725 [Solirubrobacteraceae bacterium]|jgi:mono/diheme cytochrome c family protein